MLERPVEIGRAAAIAHRLPTLIAERQGDTYIFDVHLQGEKETVFFDS